ncbi:4Fe-4S cluster-binding domain-containing protein [Staphylococcus simulans]
MFGGFFFEKLKLKTKRFKNLLNKMDVLVYGPFVKHLNQQGLAFKDSLNKRLINLPLSLPTNTIIEILKKVIFPLDLVGPLFY